MKGVFQKCFDIFSAALNQGPTPWHRVFTILAIRFTKAIRMLLKDKKPANTLNYGPWLRTTINSFRARTLLAGINGHSIRKEPRKINLMYDYCHETIICTKLERVTKYTYRGGLVDGHDLTSSDGNLSWFDWRKINSYSYQRLKNPEGIFTEKQGEKWTCDLWVWRLERRKLWGHLREGVKYKNAFRTAVKRCFFIIFFPSSFLFTFSFSLIHQSSLIFLVRFLMCAPSLSC